MFITAVCVIFLIKLRWPKSKSLYDIVKVAVDPRGDSRVEPQTSFAGLDS